MGPAEIDPAAACDSPALTIEVVCSPAPGVVQRWSGTVPAGTTALDALRLCGLPSAVTALALPGASLGVWGKRCEPDAPVRTGDRIEVCRPLEIDPKDARRLRVREQRKLRRA